MIWHFCLVFGCQVDEDKDLSVMASVELKKLFPNKKVKAL